MANRKISDLTALTAPATGDLLPIVDISEAAAADKNKKITFGELLSSAPAGSAAAPSFSFDSDPNTGIYSPGADQLAISTNGTGRLFIDASGNVGVGATPVVPFDIQQPLATQRIYSTTGTNTSHIQFLNTGGIAYVGLDNSAGSAFGAAYGLSLAHTGAYPITFVTNGSERLRITSAGLVGVGTTAPGNPLTVFRGAGVSAYIESVGNANTANPMLIGQDSAGVARIWQSGNNALGFWTNSLQRLTINGSGNVGIGTTSPGSALEINAAAATSPFIAKINTAEAARIDSSGRLLVGTSTARENFDAQEAIIAPQFQIEGTSAAQTSFAIIRNAAGASSYPRIYLAKTRGTSIGSNTVVASGDDLGELLFNGADGTNLIEAASVKAQVDGTPGANDMPGRLVFSTTADGAATPTERMRITKDGSMLLGKTTAGITTPGTEFRATLAPIFTQNGQECLYINRGTDDGVLIDLRQNNATEGTISVSGTTVSYNGAHLSRWSQLPSGAERAEILRGSVLSNLDEMCEWGNEDNEQLNRMKVSDVEGDKNVSGVFQAWDDDDDTYTDDFYCAMTGDFVIRIAEGVTVERGDLLMSAGDGTAKPQDDDIIRSKTIAKVTSTNVSCTYEDGSYCVPCVLMAC